MRMVNKLLTLFNFNKILVEMEMEISQTNRINKLYNSKKKNNNNKLNKNKRKLLNLKYKPKFHNNYPNKTLHKKYKNKQLLKLKLRKIWKK